jgi:hypothetical protein
MQHGQFDEVDIGGEAGIVPILDVGATHLVASFIGALPLTARFNTAAVGQQLMPDAIVGRDLHPDIGMGRLDLGELRADGQKCSGEQG